MQAFEEIDREGIEALQREEFIEHDGMVFRKSVFNTKKIDESLAKGLARATVQFQLNHESLLSYGGDCRQQKRHAEEVGSVWLASLEEQFPQLYPWVMIEISPSEVILSLRVLPR